MSEQTPYHSSVTELRRELMADHDHMHRALSKNPQDVARTAVLLAANGTYTLAAILGVAGREFGEDVAHRLACVTDEIMTNGDFADLNADVMSASQYPAVTAPEGRDRPPAPVPDEAVEAGCWAVDPVDGPDVALRRYVRAIQEAGAPLLLATELERLLPYMTSIPEYRTVSARIAELRAEAARAAGHTTTRPEETPR